MAEAKDYQMRFRRCVPHPVDLQVDKKNKDKIKVFFFIQNTVYACP